MMNLCRCVLVVVLMPAVIGCGSGPEPPADRVESSDVRVVPAFPELAFDWPVHVTHPLDGTDRLFVVEQSGRIWWFENRPDVAEDDKHLALDLTHKVRSPRLPQSNGGEEEGMFCLAFHPEFESNRQVFIHYTATDGRRRGVISRFTMDERRAVIDPDSEEVLLEVRQPQANHNGGMLAFGPDGYLYIGFGDGGGFGDWKTKGTVRAIGQFLRGRQEDPHDNGQDLQTLLAAMVRIDVDRTEGDLPYAVPPDNPFVGRDGARPEIWAWGLREPWRFSFDRETGELWLADVGEDDWEAVYLVPKGGLNLGWPWVEGSHEARGLPDDVSPDDLLMPVVEHPHPEMQCITGGYVYRGSRVPELAGHYVYGDYLTGRLWRFRYEEGEVRDHKEFAWLGETVSFGEDRDGELYLCSFDGRIYTFESVEDPARR